MSNNENFEIMTSNISKTIKETFERTREEEKEQSRLKDVERVLKLLIKKFKIIDITLEEKIKAADSEKLNMIIEEILDIESLEDVEKFFGK